MKQVLSILLNLCFGLFAADAISSVLDEALIVFFGVHVLSIFRGVVSLLALLIAMAVYGLMALTPMVPKRLFLPVTLFNPLAVLVMIPCVIYCYGRAEQVSLLISLGQVAVGLGILCWAKGKFNLRWPWIGEKQLGDRRFSWANLAVFLLLNIVVLIPAVAVYLVLCAGLAVNHFTAGFLALRPAGFTVQARTYVRDDGKSIQLIPMAHIGDAAFYRKLSVSFPSNSIILMEGVSDVRNLITNKVSYNRMATSLGLAEQAEEFEPAQGEMVNADLDVEQFSRSTIDFLNVAMLVHGQGVKPETIMKILQYSPPPHFEEALVEDILRKRNRRVLQEIRARLGESETIIVPWGVAHMPEVAEEIQKSGFHLRDTRDYQVIRFGHMNKVKAAGQGTPNKQ